LKRYVLDASVGAKWFLTAADETFVEEAAALLRLYVAGDVQFFVPDLFFAEFGNVLWKAAQLSRCDAQVIDAAVTEILGLGLPTFPASALLRGAVSIAREYGRSVYDSLYLALALEIEAPWITADQRLVRAIRGRLPVVWLGAGPA
jgi:predicted nucleic acid-binding protein